MVASMAYVLRRCLLPFGSEPAATMALLVLWTLMFLLRHAAPWQALSLADHR